MPFTAEQKARLKALLAKGGTLSAEETTELNDLKAKAAAAGYDPVTDTTALSDEQFKTLVADEITKALEAKGLTTEKLLVTLKGASMTPEQVADAVKKQLGEKLDVTALVEQITKAVPAGLTKEAVEKMFSDFAATMKTNSRMEHPAGDSTIEFPIAHRAGNLSVAQKQLLNVCMQKPMNDGITADQLAKAAANGAREVRATRHAVQYGTKALTTTGVGTGAELRNTDLSSDLQMRMYLASNLAAAMISSEIVMPSDPFKLPLSTTRPQFLIGAQANGNGAALPTESTPGTANPTLAAQKLIALVNYSYEADEDDVVAILPMIMDGMGKGAADSFESAIINGDITDTTHMDADIAAIANDPAKSFNGLRYYALSNSEALSLDISSGGVTAQNVRAVRKLMVKYGVNPKDLLLVCGTGCYNDLMGLDQTQTKEKFGDGATILTGALDRIFGIPIIVSSRCREDLNAVGVHDGVTSTQGSFLLIHKPSWIVGVRREFMVELWRDTRNQQNTVIASYRRAFIPLETPTAAQAIVAMGYNFAEGYGFPE